jgi:hypothetical protein
MKLFLQFIGYWLLLYSFNLYATENFPKEFEPKPINRVMPSKDPYYGAPETAIEKMLLFKRKNSSKNHFCVIGYAWPDNYIDVWVHWKEDKRLLQWRGNSDKGMRENGLIYAQSDLQLGKNTVATPEDIKGSNYLVTNAWWNALTKDCATYGQNLTIKPFK